jgi:hypothetical protein
LAGFRGRHGRFDFRLFWLSIANIHEEVSMIVTDMPVERLVPYARNPLSTPE